MPRRAAAIRREVQPDAKYNNRLVTQLINKVLLDGKKSVAEGIVYGAFDLVEAKTGEDPLSVFKSALPPRSWTQLRVRALPLSVARTFTRWPSPTVRSRTTVSRKG